MVKYCDDCGAENPNGATHCQGCGSPFIKQKLNDMRDWAGDRI